MTIWRFIDSGACSAAYNMALDEAIAGSVRMGDSPTTLRFFGWRRPSVSLGAFQKITDIDTGYCADHNVDIVRRPTGGRGILHNEELTYSFSARNEGVFSGGLLDVYRQISSAFAAGLERLGISVQMEKRREMGRHVARSALCFQATSYGELAVGGKKVIGSAQKRWSDGFLQQGSIPYAIDCATLAAVFKSGSPPHTGQMDFIGLKDIVPDLDHDEFKKHIKGSFEILFGISLVASLPTDRELEQAHLLYSEKYLQSRWTTGAPRGDHFCNNGVCRPI